MLIEFLKGARRFARRLISWTRVSVNNLDKDPPVYAQTSGPGLRIHLGAGPINIQGWVNIDAREFAHTHVRSNSLLLPEFSDGQVQEIYLCHVLEHFSFEEGRELITSLREKLAVGGILRISVPDFSKLAEIYVQGHGDLELIKYALMGGQDYEYNFHKAAFDDDSLAKLLGQCGFDNVVAWTTEEDFGTALGDWSNGTLPTRDGNRPISLNLKGMKS